MNIESGIPGCKSTLMFSEAAESGEAVKRQLDRYGEDFARIGASLRANPPPFAIMVGRGSSDHAGVYGRYLIEIMQGIVTSPSGLSVSSLYNSPLNVKNALCIATSQSGKSPDLVAAMKSIRDGGGHTLALTNASDSPLSLAAEETISLCAGPEKSVAATKSFIASLSALVQIVAHWSNDKELLKAIEELPSLLNEAWELDWSPAADAFVESSSSFVLGRGVGYGITREAALKFKETCSIHAEAYSAAEVLHGPAAIINEGFPILAFSQNDATQSSVSDTLKALSKTGSQIFCAGLSHSSCTELPTIDTHPMLQPILMIQSFYRMVNAVSLARGYNPDKPPNLSKVTETT